VDDGGRSRLAGGGCVFADDGTALENPDAVKEIWDNTPKYLKAGQDFLLRAEDVVDDLKNKGERIRAMLNKA
jgi:hypothetical protein